jgi:cold shock CspA family protein
VPDDVTLNPGDKITVEQKEDDKKPSDPVEVTVKEQPKSGEPSVDPITEGDREVTGKGEPGAEITVTWPDGSTTKDIVDENGNWEVEVPEDVTLNPGEKITVEQKEDDKKPSDPVEVTVEEQPKTNKPVVDPITEGDRTVTGKGEPGAEITVTLPDGSTTKDIVDEDGNWEVEVPGRIDLNPGEKVIVEQAEDGKKPSDPITVTVKDKNESGEPKVDPITEGDKEVTGEGTPGSEITVTWPDGSASTEEVGEDGKWSVKVPEDVTLNPGDKITVVQTEDGKKPSGPVTITVDRKGPLPPRPLPPAHGNGLPPRPLPPLPIPEVSIPKSDIPSGFRNDHIQYIKGYPDGTVMPDAKITRAETAAIIYRLLNASTEGRKYGTLHTDIAQDAWYAESVSYLSTIGVVLGYPDGTFKPDNPITRAEFAAMISRFDDLTPVEFNSFIDIEDH